jgi:outer membrane lipoprotein SlyB
MTHFHRLITSFGLFLAASLSLAQSGSASPLARYQTDLKLCADEPSSNARLQCRRDAKSEYDKALEAARPAAASSGKTTSACSDCGKVTGINLQEREGESSAIGTIAGGVAGALLGNQIGGGLGKDIATVAGAVGGAYAGREVEKKVRARQVWVVTVKYDNGNEASFDFAQEPDFKVGDNVRNAGASIARR